MLQVVAPYVAEMLHLKWLTIKVVAGVAGFQTMSTCKSNLKPLNINVVVGVFDGFSNAPSKPNSEFCTSRFVPCRVARCSGDRPLPGRLPYYIRCLAIIRSRLRDSSRRRRSQSENSCLLVPIRVKTPPSGFAFIRVCCRSSASRLKSFPKNPESW